MCSCSFDRLDRKGLERLQNISVRDLVVFIIMKSKLPPCIFMFPISVIEHKKADESQLLISYLEIKTTLSSSKLHWKDESSEYEHIHNGAS